jgi:hypothetical protein
MPYDWETDRPAVTAAARAGRGVVNADDVADADGHLIAFRGPSFEKSEASLIIRIMPTRVSQEAMARMSDETIQAAEEREFKPEIERMARMNGLRITAWLGTTRRTIGGRHGLGTSYRFMYQHGREMLKETYSVYLGTRQVCVHCLRCADGEPELVEAMNHMLRSLVISVGEL